MADQVIVLQPIKLKITIAQPINLKVSGETFVNGATQAALNLKADKTALTAAQNNAVAYAVALG